MLDLKIINGTLVIPGTGKVRAGVGVKDGKIVAIDAEDKLGDATRTVDAAGKYVIPGVIDPHVHLGIFTGDFGSECEIETRAALAGGVTTIGVFMGGGESYLPGLPGLIDTVNARSSTDLFFHLSMFTPDQLAEIPAVHRRVRRHLLQVLHVRRHRRVPERGGRLHQTGSAEAGRPGWPSHRLRALREPGHVQRRLRQGGRGDARRRAVRVGRVWARRSRRRTR